MDQNFIAAGNKCDLSTAGPDLNVP
ncbi:hypothetical protein SBV1_1660002 [Verrucomicrobia bacterium]|nr:hypothetical protein SBV1_1660002 [Verrucomicrobiota bacterium]